MTRGEGGWLFLPPAGLSPAILRQFAWRTPAGPRQRRAHRPPARPRPASAARRDVACRRTRRPRAPRPSAAARVAVTVRITASMRDRSRRRAAVGGRVPTAPRSLATGLRRHADACALPCDGVRSPAASQRGGNPREHAVAPSSLLLTFVTSSPQAHFRPVFIGRSPGNQIPRGLRDGDLHPHHHSSPQCTIRRRIGSCERSR